MEVAGQVEEVNGQCNMIHQDAEKVADIVEEVSSRCDVIHQDAGNLNKIDRIITSPGPG